MQSPKEVRVWSVTGPNESDVILAAARAQGGGMVDQKLPQSLRYRDTAFPIFILMASRRLNSDVLLWHYPGLPRAMRGVTNAFQWWMAGDQLR